MTHPPSLSPDKLQSIADGIQATIRTELGSKPFQNDVASILARVMQPYLVKQSLDSVLVPWTLDHLVGLQLDSIASQAWSFAEALAAIQEAEIGFGLGYADRYARVYQANGDVRALAIQTQSFTYLVLLIRHQKIDDEASDGKDRVAFKDVYSIHIRICTIDELQRDGATAT